MAGASLTVLAAVVGCSSSEGVTGAKGTAESRGPEPSIPALSTGMEGDPSKPVSFRGGGAVVRPDGSVTLPLDAYESPEDETVLVKGETVLAEKCMRAKGLTLPPTLKLTSGPQSPPPYVLFGVIDLAAVKEFGYREPVPPANSTSRPEPRQKISPAVSRAYFDDPKSGRTGCESEARKKLRGGNQTPLFMIIQQLTAQSLSAANGDSRVKHAQSRWSACMKDSGFAYPDPLKPAHDRSLLGRGLPIPAGATLPPPSPAEIEVAVQDVKCKRKTAYLQTVTMVTAAYQQAYIERDSLSLHEAQQARTREVRAARRLLEAAK
ncbi:hypothetical protein ACFYW1_03455 [Streptomyces sp. NPDC002669]|uniref:hypothetical protein n=1 Tax=Streptomyces sp. NPDC002669 TaxID=3364658 RepID=UPI0036CFD831